MTAPDVIANTYLTAKKLVHFVTDDLTAAELAAQPIAGGNSIAWILGHLAYVLGNTVTRLGGTMPLTLADDVILKVQTTKQPATQQEPISTKEELITYIDTAIDHLAPLLRAIPTESLDQPPLRPVPFSSTQAEAYMFGALHLGLHLGQITLIRRALGRPPLV